jgi:16S rRNA (guanine966-N2)-methyltransferase
VRVIAGDAGGVPLMAPKGQATRPTSDLLKGAIFNVLGKRGGRGRVLDLFAGSGALGIEALSRGADWCDFVESAPASCHAIEANLAKTKLADRARVHCLPVQRWLRRAPPVVEKPAYDLILADPPYALEGRETLLVELAQSPVVGPDTVLLLEHASRRDPPPVLGSLAQVRTRAHGDSAFTVYERQKD